MGALRPSLSSIQSGVGLTAGIISITGGMYSLAQLVKPTPVAGDVIAVVREAGTDRPVPRATIEFLSPDGSIVTTAITADDGMANRSLREGPYRLRVAAPPLEGDTRDVRVQAGGTSEVRFQLAAVRPTERRSGRGGPIDGATRAVDKGVSGVKRFFQRIF